MILWDHELHAATHTQYVPQPEGAAVRSLAERVARRTGLDIAALTEWYDDAMDRQMKPDPVVGGFLARLNDRQVPWGIHLSPTDRARCSATSAKRCGLDKIAPFIIVSEEGGYAKP